MLEDAPHAVHIVSSMPPVALSIQISQIETVLTSLGDASHGLGDLASDKGLPTQRRLVVEEDPVAGVHPVGFTIVDGDPVAIEFGDSVRRAGVERGGLSLWGLLDQTIQLRGRGLIEACFLIQPQNPDGLQ